MGNGGCGGAKGGPPPHMPHVNDALVEQQKAAIKQAEINVRNAKDEIERLKAEREAEIQRRVLSREPTTDRALIEEAQREIGINVISEYNFLVSGDTGAGKSSTINAILGMSATDEGAAEVGVTETTAELKKYHTPENPAVKLWDAPGAGTTNFPVFDMDNPDKHYYRRFKVFAFDCVVVFYSNRLGEGAAVLAKLCAKARQPVVIVRNKADEMVGSLLDDGKANTPENARILARQIFEQELREKLGDLAIPRFLISIRQYKRRLYEFDEIALMEYIRNAAIPRVGVRA